MTIDYDLLSMKHLLLVGLLLVITASVANAQENGKVGVAMGYPGSVSVVWQVADGLAIRPELSFRSGHSDGGSSGLSTITSTTDSSSVGVGVSALVYVKTWDALRAYVSPRV